METANAPRKKKSFAAIVLYFTLGAFALVGLAQVLGSFLPDQVAASGDKVGVVEVQGIITDSKEIVRQLNKYRKDSSVKGIILRINSPGGAVAPSQEIYNEILKIRDEKKVIASMGSLAASGGYYIASAANHIVANPGTLTGSIGVIMASSNIQQLLGKIGVRSQVIKSGKFKDAGSPLRPMTPAERQLLQNVLDDVHQQFAEAVSKARNLPMEKVRELADGRIFTGRQALEFDLVDQLGGFEDCIDLLMQLMDMKIRPKVIQEKEPRRLLDWLLEGFSSTYISDKIYPYYGYTPNLQYIWYLQ
ncbi:MAG: signal peptide peptidase SppA [Nitrospinota bacterium]|nr:signal peptide peptidase SppA [Nitrospinota bacterium]